MSGSLSLSLAQIGKQLFAISFCVPCRLLAQKKKIALTLCVPIAAMFVAVVVAAAAAIDVVLYRQLCAKR